ncbi:hypothetical protein L0Z65_09580 [Phaeobacter sp. BS52]|uniref:hypothetical protein n=1 Tax=Phaeobacter sp. BS52 TaxID=2907241 RepID=UPI003863F414
MRIDWTLPGKRVGFWGFIDTLIGPGATKAEKNLQLYPPFIFAAAALLSSASIRTLIGMFGSIFWCH